jgi:ferric-dicitrate binding protein FerR (iron transport regulator)
MSVNTVASVTDVVAWRDRRLVFHERTLAFIVSEFNRYSRKQIRLEGDDAAQRVYSGVFDVDDMDSLGQVLARDPELSVDSSEHDIVVRGRAGT